MNFYEQKKLNKINDYIRKYLNIYSYLFNEQTINEFIQIVKCYDIDKTSFNNSKLFRRALCVLMKCNFAEAIVESGIRIATYNSNNQII